MDDVGWFIKCLNFCGFNVCEIIIVLFGWSLCLFVQFVVKEAEDGCMFMIVGLVN